LKNWSNIAKVTYCGRYSREQTGGERELWQNTIERSIKANLDYLNSWKHLLPYEGEQLEKLLRNRKASPAGRGLWYNGCGSHDKLGGAALNNCWFLTLDKLDSFVMAQDYLMLGGGVGASVEHRFISKLPNIKPDVTITHVDDAGADFIVPDTREGWNDLTQRTLDSFFVTGRSFTFSTIVVRGAGQPIRGFGGVSSGPLPLIDCISRLCSIFLSRVGKHLRPLDCADIICAIADMVVAGNVRRSAIIILGDCWDGEYLRAKRFDLGSVPSYRARANFSVVCSNVEDLHPSFWKTYEVGEPFGIVNRKTIRRFGRTGELRPDSAIGVNPCAEATLEDGEPCNLQEIWLPNLDGQEEFNLASRLMHRWGKRVTMEKYHNERTQEVVQRNRRVGTGTTGCLQSNLFRAPALDEAYQVIQRENVDYSKILGIPRSIRTTVVKPSGTLSLIGETTSGIHCAYSRFYIRRIRFASNDPIVGILKENGHHTEVELNYDGTPKHDTQVVTFYERVSEGTPVADKGWSLEDQFRTVLLAQKHWSDQSVSCTIYYDKANDIPSIKEWLSHHLGEIKTISFLSKDETSLGSQMPLEAITEVEYDKGNERLRPFDVEEWRAKAKGTSFEIQDQSLECEGEICPAR